MVLRTFILGVILGSGKNKGVQVEGKETTEVKTQNFYVFKCCTVSEKSKRIFLFVQNFIPEKGYPPC